MKYSLSVVCILLSFSLLSANGIRPTMVDFKISLDDNSNAVVEWIANNEYNLDAYVIEKSNDNKYFQAVSKIKAKSEEGVLNQYRVVDRDLNYGESYYRLKYIDANGDWNLSLTLQVKKDTPLVFSLLPCPESRFVNVELDKKGAKTIEIFHIATGEKMLTYNMQGNQEASIPTHDLENGQYWMKINFERRSQSLRFIKQ